MPRVLSQDLRERVVTAIDGGMSCRAAAARFGVSAASAIRWRQLVVQHGTPAAKPHRSYNCQRSRAGPFGGRACNRKRADTRGKQHQGPARKTVMVASRGSPIGFRKKKVAG